MKKKVLMITGLLTLSVLSHGQATTGSDSSSKLINVLTELSKYFGRKNYASFFFIAKNGTDQGAAMYSDLEISETNPYELIVTTHSWKTETGRGTSSHEKFIFNLHDISTIEISRLSNDTKNFDQYKALKIEFITKLNETKIINFSVTKRGSGVINDEDSKIKNWGKGQNTSLATAYISNHYFWNIDTKEYDKFISLIARITDLIK